MAGIAGVTFIKNSSGKVTHAKFSVKHHRKLIDDMEGITVVICFQIFV